jgi:hypothetical protein
VPLTQVPCMSPYPGPRLVVILDDARVHNKHLLFSLITGMGMLVHFLPPYSPDYNPIENLCGWLKMWYLHNVEIIKGTPGHGVIDWAREQGVMQLGNVCARRWSCICGGSTDDRGAFNLVWCATAFPMPPFFGEAPVMGRSP